MKYFLVFAAVLAVCSWVASDSNYYNIARATGQKCKCRVGATDLDVEVIATHQPLKTEVQKKLLHCAYEQVNIVCGDFLSDMAYMTWIYTRAYDGDLRMFNDVNAKIQESYNAGKEFDGVDGMKIVDAMHNCFNKQWNQVNEKVQRPRDRPVFTIDKSHISTNVTGIFKVNFGVL